MLDPSRFPDFLSSFYPQRGPRPPDAGAKTEADDSEKISNLLSNSKAATFDRTDPSILPQEGGYQSINSSRQISLGFEFNLSIERTVLSQSDGGRSYLKAQESSSLFYQSLATSSEGSLGSSFGEVRSYHTESFYSRTRELSTQLEPHAGERLQQTSQKVVRAFEIDISLEFSFLGQFTRQSDTISDLDSGLFEAYLDRTDGISLGAGQDLQKFFDDVDTILQETESFIQSSLESFFSDLGTQIGLTAGETGDLRTRVSQEVTAFFDDIDTFLSDARTSLTEFEPNPPSEESPNTELQGDLVAA